MTGTLLWVSLSTLSDYKLRHINVSAASVSFYAIFSVFPLLAFLAYLVGQVSGSTDGVTSTHFMMNWVSEYLPGTQAWIGKSLLGAVKANSVSTWTNGALLAWSGLSLFTAIESVFEHLPQHEHQARRGHVTRAFLILLTFVLSVGLALIVLTSELASHSPSFGYALPEGIRAAVVLGARNGILSGIASILIVGSLYWILLPFRIRLRYAFGTALMFSMLLLSSKSIFSIYRTHSQARLQSTYGAFSTLVVLALWVHFLVSCGVFCALFAYHLELNRRRNYVRLVQAMKDAA